MVVDDMNDSEWWAQGFRYYEQLRAMVDMNDFRCELRVLGVMNNFEV